MTTNERSAILVSLSLILNTLAGSDVPNNLAMEILLRIAAVLCLIPLIAILLDRGQNDN